VKGRKSELVWQNISFLRYVENSERGELPYARAVREFWKRSFLKKGVGAELGVVSFLEIGRKERIKKRKPMSYAGQRGWLIELLSAREIL